MSDRLSPGPDAKARFQALAEKEFFTFFDEIPAPAMQGVAQYLPSVDGFRKTSLAGIAKQKTALARKLTKANANDRDFNGLYLIWRTWIDANFKNPKAIHKLMDELEEAVDQQASAEARRLTIEQHADAFLQKLKDESQQNHCTREQIERLFTFSPLPETPAARGLIAAAKSATEVDRDATLSELPKRLQFDEDEIERIKSELKQQSERLDQISASVEAFRAHLDKFNASLAEARLSAQNAQDAVEALVKVSRTQDDSPKPSVPDNSAMDLRIAALANAVESRRDEIRNLASKLEDLDTLLNAARKRPSRKRCLRWTDALLR
jgi:chromosome segregation ATPase